MLWLLGLLGGATAAPMDLTNGIVTAVIDSSTCMLGSVTAAGDKHTYSVGGDDVSFELSNSIPPPGHEASPPAAPEVLRFSALKLAHIAKAGPVVTCTFQPYSLRNSTGRTATVVPTLQYEAKPGWTFISRRARLSPAHPSGAAGVVPAAVPAHHNLVMVGRVSPFSGTIATLAASSGDGDGAGAGAGPASPDARNDASNDPLSVVYSQAAGGVFVRAGGGTPTTASVGVMVVVQNNFVLDKVAASHSAASPSPPVVAASRMGADRRAHSNHQLGDADPRMGEAGGGILPPTPHGPGEEDLHSLHCALPDNGQCILSLQTAATAAVCAEHCTASALCASWSWATAGATCYLLDNATRAPIPDPAASCGWKAWNPRWNAIDLGYNADMPHDFSPPAPAPAPASAPFDADLVLFAPYSEQGAAAAAVPYAPSGLTAAEYRRFWSAAEAFLLTPPSARAGTTKMHVPWTANFLEEVDIAHPENMEQAKRVITRCSELGIKHILWSARDSAVSNPINSTDSWDWGASLWLNVGEHIGAGRWFPSKKGAALPPTTRALVDYAAQHGVHLCPYIYPSDGMRYTPDGELAPWVFQTGAARGACPLPACHMSLPSPTPCAQCYNQLASREFQDFLIAEIGAFVDLAGSDGAGFDYTFINDGASSAYAQWAGWRRILSTVLRTRKTMQVDNRQSNHAWGPWMWVATGTYAEPIQSDEQPESWRAFTPDLHTARLTANRMRQMNFDYRYAKLCPAATAPGFFSHQSDMTNITGARAWDNNRFIRDFDYFGYPYALLSSVGSAGLNNVINTLPARDADEFNSFPAADLAFIKGWLAWTDSNIDLLMTAAPLPVAPGASVVDGTAMTLNNTGYIFLFNPNSAATNAPNLVLDASLGYDCSSSSTTGTTTGTTTATSTGSSTVPSFVVAEVYPAARNLGVVACGSKLLVAERDGKSATVLKISPVGSMQRDASGARPLLLGVSGSVVVDADTGDVSITGVDGEQGTTSEVQIVLPLSSQQPEAGVRATAPRKRPRRLTINGVPIDTHEVPADRLLYAGDVAILRATVRHGRACSVASAAGSTNASDVAVLARRFRQSEQVNGSVVGTTFKGSFAVPAAVFAQLAARNKTYPVQWDSNDLTASWLSPGRLLLFVDGGSVTLQAGYKLNVTARLDGKAWPVLRSFNCRGLHRDSCYNGPYLDLTQVVPDVQHTVEIEFAGAPSPLAITGVFFDNVAPIMTDEVCSTAAHFARA